MPYPFQVTFRPDGTDITTTLWVDDRQEIANAISPEYCNDWSADVNQMREIANPGDVGSESLAVDLAGELRRLRFKIKQIADRLNGSPVAQWYSSFPGDLAVADGGTGASTPEGARANLGLGTMSTQNANAVSITGGTINDVTMGGSAITYAAKIMAKQGAGGPLNPNNAGYVFSGDNDTGFFEVADGGPIDVYLNGVKKYAFGIGFLDLLAGQIKFPASQLASANANTLDDYEEGTWTPTLIRTITNPSYTTSEVQAEYAKIGRTVVLCFFINISSVTAQGSGDWKISGLPFTCNSLVHGTGSSAFNAAFLKAHQYEVHRNGTFMTVMSNGVIDSSSVLSPGTISGFAIYHASS